MASYRIHLSKLHNENLRKKIMLDLNRGLRGVSMNADTDVEMQWNQIKESINNTCENHLKPSPIRCRQKWMTPEILQLMELRRKQKNNPSEYRKNSNYKIAYRSINALHNFIKIHKDKLPRDFLSCVVYEISCSDCDTTYVGQTKRKISTRVKK